MSLCDTNKLLLQGLLAERICSTTRARGLLAQAKGSSDATEADLARAVDSVNERLTRLDMRLQFGLNDITGENFVALVNLSGDKAAQLATDFTAHEITFIQKAIELIVKSQEDKTKYPFQYEKMKLLNEASAKSKVSKADGDKLIQQLIENKWLKYDDDSLTLGLRTLIELKTYLRDGFPDQVFNCALCSEIVALGETCANEECNAGTHDNPAPTRLHIRCSRQYYQNAPNKLCKTCRQPWVFLDQNFEVPLSGMNQGNVRQPTTSAAVPAADAASANGNRRASNEASKRQRVTVSQDNDDDDGAAAEEEEPQGGSSSSSSSRRSTRRR